MKTLKTLLLMAVIAAFLFGQAKGQKITVDEIIQKSLDSVGTPSDRSQIHNIFIKGDVKLAVHRLSGFKTDGKVVLASESNKAIFRIAVKPPPEYKMPGTVRSDNIVYDGSDLQVGYPEVQKALGPGALPVISDFEEFIHEFNPMVKDGLLGGVLLTGWNLANRAVNKGELEYDGTETADGEKFYVLKFNPKDGSNVKVRIFFDAVTFQHRRTEYHLTLHGMPTSIGTPSGQGISPPSPVNYMKFIEVFSEFSKEGQLMLPHKYTIDVKAPVLFQSESEYTLELKEFYFNVPFDPASFNVVKGK